MNTYTITGTWHDGHDAVYTINGTTYPADSGSNEIAEAATGEEQDYGCCDACGGVEPGGPAYTIVHDAMEDVVQQMYAIRYGNRNARPVVTVTVTA